MRNIEFLNEGLNVPQIQLLPFLGCASCCQTFNQTGKLNQIGCKIKKKRQKEAWKVEGEPQCATIYCCPPKLPSSGVTFHWSIGIKAKLQSWDSTRLNIYYIHLWLSLFNFKLCYKQNIVSLKIVDSIDRKLNWKQRFSFWYSD